VSDFPIQELFVKDDLIGINKEDIHFFQCALAKNGVKARNGRDIVETFAVMAVEVGKNEINVIMGQGL